MSDEYQQLTIKKLQSHLRDIEDELVDALCDEKTHRERDAQLKSLIRNLREARKRNAMAVDDLPF